MRVDMKELLKFFYWDMAKPEGRHSYIQYFIRDIPGKFGMTIRRSYYKRLFGTDGKGLNILPGAYIINPHKIECGDNVSIGVCNYIQAGGGLVFGNNLMLGPHAKIWTQNHNFSNTEVPIKTQGYTYKKVIIGEDVWIGANAFIMPGAEIGSHSIVSACSVVGEKKYPEGIILAGNPARKIGER